jgi:hypothetical protein
MSEVILIEYKAEVASLRAALTEMQLQLKNIENEAKKSGKGTSNAFKKAGSEIGDAFKKLKQELGIALGVQQVISFGKESIKAFAEAEVNANKLKFAVTQIGKEGSLAYQKLIDQSNKLQDISIFSDDDIQKAQTQLATLGLNSKQIEELIPKVLDLASATGQGLGQATDSIIQGINGQTRSLKAVGLAFVATGDKTKNLAILSENLTKFQGSTAAALETTAGKAKRLENAIDNLKEGVGEYLVGAGNDLLDAFDILSGKVSIAESGIQKFNSIFQKVADKNNAAILKKAGESESARVEQVKASEKRIADLKQESLTKSGLANINAINLKLKQEIFLQNELKKLNQVNDGLSEKTIIDPSIAAKALDLKKQQAIELRDLQASIIKDEKSKEIQVLINKFTDIRALHVGQFEYLAALEESFGQERDAILKKYADKEIETEMQIQSEIDKFLQEGTDKELARIKKFKEDEANISIEAAEKEAEDIKRVKQASFDGAVYQLNALAQIQQNLTSQQLEELNYAHESETKALDSELKNKLISQQEYDIKKANLEKKQRDEAAKINKKAFETQKTVALINAIIDTAAAVLKAQKAAPPPYNYALMAIAAANGAAQLAIINSQPTPKFAKGGKVGGRLHSQGGTLIEAEKDEWIIKRNESIKNNSLLDAINKGKGQKYIYEMYVAPALKEQLKKHNTSKDNDFASSIASSMMLNNGALKDGNILESLKMNRRSEKENADRLILAIKKQQINLRNIV